MKITAVLVLAACLHVSAKSWSQNVTLSLKEASLQQVFQEIRKQTGYNFIYNDTWLDNAKKVSITVNNAPLTEVLDICVKDQAFTYTIIQKTIALKLKDAPPKKEELFIPPPVPRDIHGKVVNEKGEPLESITVTVKGTRNASATNVSGEFVLAGVDAGATLVFTGTDVETFEIRINGKTEVAIHLKTKVSRLDEVQLIAYGQTTKRLSTGNITTVKAEDIAKQPINNPLLALEGRVPGMFITQASGFSGSGVTVRIQGVNSIGGGNDPLYVIDGVPYTSQLLPTISSVFGVSGGGLATNNFAIYGSPLSYINPADIESIEILKDADATAIYGSRAANGAILITTKKGKAGEQKVECNFQQGWGHVAGKMDLLDRRQYLDMRYEALKNDGISLASLDQTGNYDLTVWDTTRSTDWQKVLIGNTAQYTDLQTTISGGNANTYFSIGGGYHRETAVVPGDFNDQKGSLHFQITSNSANQKFRIRLTGNYMADINRLPHTLTTDLTDLAIQLPPVAPPLYNTDGSINWAPNAAGNSTWDYPGNPVAQLLNKYTNKTNNLVSNVDLSYRLLPGLYIKSSFGYNNLQSNETVTVPLLSTAPELRQNTTRIGIYGNNDIRSWIIEPQVSYEKTIGKGKLGTLIGATIQQNNSEGQRLYGFGYTTDEAINNISSATRVQAEPGIENTYKYNALFGRINYVWDTKYILDLNARRDGSSRFGSKNQLHNFGSVGGAWIFSEENYVRKHIPFLSFGKIKASYGTTGNDQIGEYQYLSLYNSVTAGVPYQGINTLQVSNLPNPYIQWEETRKLNIGLDLGFLKDRILINANYFRNRSSNQLLAYQLPITTGVSSISENFPATVQNSGFEFTLNTTNIETRNFTWSCSINLTLPENKLVEFPGIETSTYANNLVVGEPITIVKKFHLLGVDPATGAYYFNSKTNPYNPVLSSDATVLINTTPAFYGGFQNSINYKGFQLDVLLQFVKQKGPNDFFGRFPGATRLNQPVYVLDRWRQPGDIASHQRFNSNFSVSGQWLNAATSSDAAFSDASFARLKNLSLSWQLPGSLVKRIHVHGLRVYAHGQNLFTITNYKGLDPETLSSATLPVLRVITVGLQVSL